MFILDNYLFNIQEDIVEESEIPVTIEQEKDIYSFQFFIECILDYHNSGPLGAFEKKGKRWD